MIPTRSQLGSLRLDDMFTASNRATSLGDFAYDEGSTVNTTVTGLDWSGVARSAAVDRAGREQREFNRVGAAFDKLALAITSGHDSMTRLASLLKNKASGYEESDYEVADNWSVTDGYNYSLADALAADDPDMQQRLATLKQDRADAARDATTDLKTTAREFSDADMTCANSVRAAAAALSRLAPISSAIGAGMGDDIAKKLLSGAGLTADELAALRSATSLTPDQLRALASGQRIQIPQGQYDFLRSLMGDLSPKSIDDLRRIGVGDQHNSVQTALGNAIQISSMPKLTTAASDHGGMALLPKSASSLLTESLIGDSFKTTGNKVGAGRKNGIVIPRIHDFETLVDIINSGNPELRVGTDVDRGLVKQAAEISAATSDPHVIVRESPSAGAGTGFGRGELDNLLTKALDGTSVDRIAMHDAITGQNMDVTCSAGGHYDVSTHLNGILDHGWGKDATGADKIFDWLHTDAQSNNPYLAGLAHESATSLGHYLGNVHNLPVTQQFGMTSPHLAETLAHAASTYMGGYSGAMDGPHGVPTFGVDSLTEGELHTLFRALDSSPESASIINQAGSQWQNYMAYQYGLHHDNGSLAYSAGLINSAMSHGYRDELNYLTQSAYGDEAAQYQNKMNAYTQANAVIGLVPYGNYLTAALPPSLAEGLFGAPPDPSTASSPESQGLNDVGVPSLNDPNVREFSKFVGYAESHPEVAEQHPAWFKNGRPDWTLINKGDNFRSWNSFVASMGANPGYGGWDSTFERGAQTPDIPGAGPVATPSIPERQPR